MYADPKAETPAPSCRTKVQTTLNTFLVSESGRALQQWELWIEKRVELQKNCVEACSALVRMLIETFEIHGPSSVSAMISTMLIHYERVWKAPLRERDLLLKNYLLRALCNFARHSSRAHDCLLQFWPRIRFHDLRFFFVVLGNKNRCGEWARDEFLREVPRTVENLHLLVARGFTKQAFWLSLGDDDLEEALVETLIQHDCIGEAAGFIKIFRFDVTKYTRPYLLMRRQKGLLLARKMTPDELEDYFVNDPGLLRYLVIYKYMNSPEQRTQGLSILYRIGLLPKKPA
jgi:hypothetical protein